MTRRILPNTSMTASRTRSSRGSSSDSQLGSEQPQALHAGMPPAADDDVVVQGDPEERRRLRHLARRLDVGLGGCRVARGVVVDHDERAGAEVEGALYHLAGIDRRVIDRAALLPLVGDERALAGVARLDAMILIRCCK